MIGRIRELAGAEDRRARRVLCDNVEHALERTARCQIRRAGIRGIEFQRDAGNDRIECQRDRILTRSDLLRDGPVERLLPFPFGADQSVTRNVSSPMGAVTVPLQVSVDRLHGMKLLKDIEP